jgi:hypothetical protein
VIPPLQNISAPNSVDAVIQDSSSTTGGGEGGGGVRNSIFILSKYSDSVAVTDFNG